MDESRAARGGSGQVRRADDPIGTSGSIQVEVLGSGCPGCRRVLAVIRIVARRLELDVRIVRIGDPSAIAAQGILSQPGIVVDGRVMSVGRVPTAAELTAWLREAAERRSSDATATVAASR